VWLDVTNDKIDGLFIGETNPQLVEGSRKVNVPYRWVQAVGDIVLLKYFPAKVVPRRAVKEQLREETEEE
jgi:sporulation protein YlmC with PRC-barrel domain